MPLASLFSLQWYGPGAGAGVLLGEAAATADIKARARPSGDLSGAGAVPLAKPTRLVNRPAPLASAGALTGGPMRARARIAAPIRVGEFTQDDVSGGVLNAVVEGDLTVAATLRLLLSQATGNAAGLDGGAISFRSLDGSKVRVAGTVSGGTRTVTTRDGS